MKPIMTTALLALMLPGVAHADSRIERFCGAGHQNEVATQEAVKPNPAGYYVVPLREQVDEGDPRIILTNDQDFHLCTRPVATPNMSANDAYLQSGKREVKFLFVPILNWRERTSS
ncbi:hypothetical protein [Defluviimonas sp. WL0075]|uniref:Uncharacterized protein n=1 Tax=Albidovulum sediminicola TaxID=2984331 RepID=A0ABT2Z418_9RHOB|nr:hypothetical protein [Defluviimonas sp. WL0075]MCV2865884.1 hypothetical protein [Defluviimonas sp. WL0075]